MLRTPGTPLFSMLASFFLSGCGCLVSHPCATHSLIEKKDLLRDSFHSCSVSTSQRAWTVYIPNGSPDEHGPPVLLLHEMPALSGDVLDLGLRLKKEGFAVYIPLLFGKENDNPRDPTLFVRRAISLSNDPAWLAGKGEVHRPIVDQVGALCREYILPRHKGQRLGIIGNCVTGSIPIALLGERPEVAGLIAPVISQPALPLPSCSAAAKKQTGVSAGELQLAQQRVREDHLEILGFRFECDGISPPERFAGLRNAFAISGREYFIDRTVPKKEYVGEDGLDKRSHSVLAGCYRPAEGSRIPSTEVAWCRLRNFLHAKLDGPVALPYHEEFPNRLLQ